MRATVSRSQPRKTDLSVALDGVDGTRTRGAGDIEAGIAAISATRPRYRPDIDGLRAIAVGAVLLFHAFPGGVTGGYVGVDVFFVISGFLITSLLLEEVARERFSIVRFYVRRARRLFPALIVVLLATMIIGWAILLPREYQPLGKHVTAGGLFVSNIALWREANYFDTSSEFKPLLHLWSLGVEEQYYLFWPILIYALVLRRRALFWGGSAAIAAASFVLCVVLADRAPTFAFYSPVTRMWELLAGSGVAAYFGARSAQRGPTPALVRRVGPLVLAQHGLSVAGLLAIVLSIVCFDATTVFPSYAALAPVLGSAAIIAAGPDSVINRYLLSRRALIGLGLISYPLYLWHWPLLAYARMLSPGDLSPATAALIEVAALLLAFLTYRHIELPIRAPARSSFSMRDAVGLWTAVASIAVFGLGMWYVVIQPRSASSARVQDITASQGDWDFPGNRAWPGDTERQVLFIGDSHMQQYIPRIAQLAAQRVDRRYSLLARTEGGCAPLPGIERRGMHCSRFVDEALALAASSRVKAVVIAASWQGLAIRKDYYRVGDPARRLIHPFAEENAWLWDEWTQSLKRLQGMGKELVFVVSSPRGRSLNLALLVDRWTWGPSPIDPVPRAHLKQAVAEVDAKIRSIAQTVGAKVLDPFDSLCSDVACPIVDNDGKPLFIDESHLRASFVRDHVTMLDDLVYDHGPF